jgi:D-beta-D-heptose 7-phosphate kinase/D-beta-D-heptose 1-phosphate adenosyltransferase
MKKISKNKKVKKTKNKNVVVAVSGGFDPVHIGHVRMFNEAKKLGDKLVVILNNDNWLKAKKGYCFMDQNERKEIIEAFEAVDEVVFTDHPENPLDMSVCHKILEIKPHIFANGGDRTNNNVPELVVCEQISCATVYNVGHGGKVQSSSWLIEKAKKHKSAKSVVVKPIRKL